MQLVVCAEVGAIIAQMYLLTTKYICTSKRKIVVVHAVEGDAREQF